MKNMLTICVSRFNPETDETPYVQSFENITYEPMETVLDILLKIRHETDPSLTFRYSCQCTICGSCAMQINGVARLACGTRIGDMAEKKVITVEPLRHFPVIKDLVADIEPMICNLKKVVPWLVRDHAKPLPEKEFIIRPNEISDVLQRLDRCILCGICRADNDADKSLVSPVSMVKSLKLLSDPRDSLTKSRIIQLVELGLLKHPDECSAICPKGIDMTKDVFMPLKEKARELSLI